jgi:membrane protein implicated in regulation of membrane protease activity
MAWIIWLIVAAAFGVAELLTTTFALGIIAVAALVAAGVGGVHASLPFQLLAFARRPAAYQAAATAPDRHRGAHRQDRQRAGRGHPAQRPGPHRRRGLDGTSL